MDLHVKCDILQMHTIVCRNGFVVWHFVPNKLIINCLEVFFIVLMSILCIFMSLMRKKRRGLFSCRTLIFEFDPLHCTHGKVFVVENHGIHFGWELFYVSLVLPSDNISMDIILVLLGVKNKIVTRMIYFSSKSC